MLTVLTVHASAIFLSSKCNFYLLCVCVFMQVLESLQLCIHELQEEVERVEQLHLNFDMFLKVQQGTSSHTTPVYRLYISMSLDSHSLTNSLYLPLCRMEMLIKLLRGQTGRGKSGFKRRQRSRGWRRSMVIWLRGNRSYSVRCRDTLCIRTSWSGWSKWQRYCKDFYMTEKHVTKSM